MYAIFWPAPYSVPPQFVQCVHKVCCLMLYSLCTPSQRVSAWVSLAAHLIAKQCKERRCKEGSLLENTEHSNNTLIEGELKTNKYIKCHQVTTDNTLILELLNSQRSYFPLSVCVCTITFAFMYIAHKFYISYFQPCIYNIQCTLWAQRGAHSRDISHRWHLATGILRCVDDDGSPMIRGLWMTMRRKSWRGCTHGVGVMMGPSQWGEETITVRANGETHAMMLRIRLRCYDTQMLRKQNHGWVKGIDWHTCQSLFEVFVFFFQCVCRCLQMPTQHSTVRIVWILEYGMVWSLSRGTGGEQNGAIIINLTAIIIINRWHWYHHGGGLEMIFSHQMLCNHFHQPFLHYHHPQVQALYHCHDLCITPANSWSTSRYAQVHPKMLQKRQSFHFWKISAHWAGLLGHPILSRQKVPRSQRLRQEKGSQRQSLNVGRSFCGK